jgi:hypothetical protein
METIGKLKFVLLAAGILLGLMILKTSEKHAWKGKKDQIAEKIVSGSCFISSADLKKFSEPVTLLLLGNAVPDSLLISAVYPGWRLSFHDLASRETVRKLKSSAGRYVIVSSSRADGVKAWVILDQLGVQHLFILSGRVREGEVLKYRFRPDTTFSLEPQEDNQ